MSLRHALIGGILVLGTIAVGTVVFVGVVSIREGVVREAQSRVNHDLDTVCALYEQDLQAFLRSLQEKLPGLDERIRGADVAQVLTRWKPELGCTVLNLCDDEGRPVAGAYGDANASVPVRADSMLRCALGGDPAVGTTILSPERLTMEGGAALRNALAVAPRTGAGGGGTESALFQWVALPVQDSQGKVTGVLYGGRALNHNREMVDTLRDVIFGSRSQGGKPLGTVTVFLEGTRVATNVIGPDGRRALGTEVSSQVREEVLGRGQRWQARAWVVDAWYLSGYQPLRDFDGSTVGMLYVGLLEAPYARLQSQLLIRFLAPAGGVLVLGLVGGAWLVRRVTRPLARLRDGAERIAEGNWEDHVAEGPTYSEVADLAASFRRMQEAIQTRDQLLQAQNRELAETNEKLRETNSNYMTTLRFITHELKAPLAAMQSMIDVLLGSLLGDVPEKMRHPLVRIKRNCEELQDMVKNYLDLARAERGELVADKTPIDLRPDVVDPAVTQARPLLESRSVTLEVDCPETLALTADADLLRIALGNYLSNAAKYGKEGGLARLEVRVQHDSVTVSVWNEGVGFSTDEARRLFDKFSRLRNANTRDKRGSGLGLFISGQIVALHGGTVWAESEEGKWARFSLRLPLDGAVATEH